jgi:hypothetical protein
MAATRHYSHATCIGVQRTLYMWATDVGTRLSRAMALGFFFFFLSCISINSSGSGFGFFRSWLPPDRGMAGEVVGFGGGCKWCVGCEAVGAPPTAAVVDGGRACMEVGASCLEWLVLVVVEGGSSCGAGTAGAGRGSGSRQGGRDQGGRQRKRQGRRTRRGDQDREGAGGSEWWWLHYPPIDLISRDGCSFLDCRCILYYLPLTVAVRGGWSSCSHLTEQANIFWMDKMSRARDLVGSKYFSVTGRWSSSNLVATETGFYWPTLCLVDGFWKIPNM